MVAEVRVLLELRVVEALAAVEDARLPRFRGEAAECAHDRVTHPLPLPTRDTLRYRAIPEVELIIMMYNV